MKKIIFLCLIIITNISYAEKPRIAVLDLQAKGISKKDALVASELLRTALIDSKVF